MRFSIYQESRKGGRRINQDRMGYLYSRDSLLMLVADGMGGHARGEVAAELTLQTIAAMYQREAKPLLPDPGGFLSRSVMAAHRELLRYRAEQGMPEAPRTTLVACVIQRGVAVWAHAGDSRLYLLRGGKIAERTGDHSRVQHLVATGAISAAEARDHPERNRIFNCVGAFVAPVVEVSKPMALRGGDTLFLCTDGLWGNLAEGDIEQAFASGTVMRAVPELLDRAVRQGGSDVDNCTAVAMTWAGVEAVDMVPYGDGPVSTLAVPEGAVASTIQIPRAGGDPDPELTDDQIDEAVAEIQRAIQRAAKLIDPR